MAGRKTIYTPGLGDEICRRLSDGESLNAICKDEHMPAESTVRLWVMTPGHPISASYTQARELGYLRMADELLEIADDGTNDYVEKQNKDGSTYEAVDHDHIARSRLRVDTRKWILAKCLPKVYGDRVTNEITGKDGGPIETKQVDDLELARKIAFALGRAVGRKEADVERT